MNGERPINTTSFAETMRSRIIRPAARQILVSRMAGSDQESDLTALPNCAGLGRIRHFRRDGGKGWPENPLPIDPAAKALGIPAGEVMRAQVFQNAACAWRCWYCYVPFNLLNGDASRGEWVTSERLVDLYAREPERPALIDLSGGSPDLTPEWIVWVMEALGDAGLADTTFLWSDDNLSTDYVFTRLDEAQRKCLSSYCKYARVCCFKGFDGEAFTFNTQAAPDDFERQFERFSRYLELGLDLYGYVTLTGPHLSAVARGVPDLMDRLQALDVALPLRIVPLRIQGFTPTREREARRTDIRYDRAQDVQQAAVELWTSELLHRFSEAERSLPITDVKLGCRR